MSQSRVTKKSYRWSKEDETLLFNLRKQYPAIRWKEIAAQFAASNPERPRSTNALKIKYHNIIQEKDIVQQTKTRESVSQRPLVGLGIHVPTMLHDHFPPDFIHKRRVLGLGLCFPTAPIAPPPVQQFLDPVRDTCDLALNPSDIPGGTYKSSLYPSELLDAPIFPSWKPSGGGDEIDWTPIPIYGVGYQPKNHHGEANRGRLGFVSTKSQVPLYRPTKGM